MRRRKTRVLLAALAASCVAGCCAQWYGSGYAAYDGVSCVECPKDTFKDAAGPGAVVAGYRQCADDPGWRLGGSSCSDARGWVGACQTYQDAGFGTYHASLD